MPISTVGSNIVVLATAIRPAMFSESWLNRIGAIPAGTHIAEHIKTEPLALVKTSLLEIQALPERITIAFAAHGAREYREMIEPSQSLILNLPEPGITAIGINHNILVSQDVIPDMGNFTERYLAPSQEVRAIAGNGASTWSSGYTTEWRGCALRTKLAPARERQDTALDPTMLSVSCNCHFNLSEAAPLAEQVRDIVGLFSDAQAEAYRIAAAVAGLR